MANPALSTLQDPFTGPVINTGLWSNITAGTASLDGANDLVVLQQPTVSGTTNSFGSNTVYDATNSAIYAEVGPSANGNGQTKTIFKVMLDATNWASIRLSAGTFLFTVETAGTDAVVTLPAYNPNSHGWWRLRESGGSWNADVSADGFNWSTLATTAHTWAVTAVTFVFQTSAGATEAAGNVATIQHVNSMLGGPFNINWPVLEEGWSPFWDCNGGDVPLDRYVDLTSRTEGQSSTTRGRQYETDQIEAGTATFTVQNKDGVLDPDNGASPFAGHIQPAQPYRKRAQWPPTRNLLSQVQATAGDLGGQPLGTINAGNTGPSIFSGSDTTHGSFVTSASAWQGGVCMQFTVPTTSPVPTSICYTPQPAVLPGATYSGSLQVRNITAATTVQVYASLVWLDDTENIISASAGTTTTLTGAATAWTALTVTGTAPANAAMLYAGVRLFAAPAANCAVQVDGWQLERTPAPSAWTCPGIWYPWASGFTDEWAAAWTNGGTYGTITPTTYDTFGLLSQKMLVDPLTQEINLRNPRFLYPLNDPSGSIAATDQTGNYPAAPVQNSKAGAGSLTFGNDITSNTSTGAFVGSGGTVVRITNPNPGSGTVSPATFISLTAAGIKGPANLSTGSWTRMLAFRYTGPNGTLLGPTLWSSFDANHGNGSSLSIQIVPVGILTVITVDPTGTETGYFASPGNVADSNWHLLFFSYNAATHVLQTQCDTTQVSNPSVTTMPTTLVGDSLGAWVDPATLGGTNANYQGDLAFAAEFPTALAFSDMSAIYTAWKTAGAGESTDARYARILGYAGFIGQSSLQPGLTTSMGAPDYAGQDALSALQDVVTTENGTHFVARDGTVTFQARSARYNALTPVYTFGERTDLGEWPYEDAQPTRDTAHLANIVQVTQTSTGQVFSAASAAAQVAYFPKTLTRDVNSTNTAECQDAANYLLSRYVNPVTRIQTLLLHPSANPAMWPVCLSLELGMRVRVMRRPPAPAPPITVDCFIEQINTDNDDTGEAHWTLQCSPVDATPYGTFASLHTTLHTTVASGVTSITINAGVDNTNLAAMQITQGQLLVLGLGTANVETVTVSSVAATSPGWTTAVITLTTGTAKSHTAGDVICEPLPAGVTDPTTWDKVAMFDSIAFAY